MEISIGGIPAVTPGENRRHPKPNAKPYKGKDRRKATEDRRKSVREGVFISISFKDDRRRQRDRRRTNQ